MARNFGSAGGEACSPKQLLKLLERATPSSQHVGNTFQDWIRLCTLARRRVERARAAGTHELCEGALCADEESEYKRLVQPYGRDRAELLCEALAMVMTAAAGGDALLGDVYEEIGQSKGAQQMFGQYFTPHTLCDCIAQVAGASQVDAQVSERLDEAAAMAGVSRDGRGDQEFWLEAGSALKPHLQPVSVIDPACGSGNLLHAFAKHICPWLRAAGMVWFYGIDLDRTCAEMCALQLWVDGCQYRVYHGDGLATCLVSTVVVGAQEAVPTLHSETLARFDYALVNPPFGKHTRTSGTMQPVLA